MAEKSKGGLMPRLRFPEFRDAGEWVNKRLEDVAPLQRGFDLPSDKLTKGTIPVVYSNGIQNFNGVSMAKGPGLITGRSGTIGRLHFIEHEEYWPHNTTLWVTSFKGNYPKFIYYLYSFIGLERFSSGSGVPTLNRNTVHDYQTYLPILLCEQQKIAACFSSLDDLITAEAKKLDVLKAHKKGLMQELFPREGETVPRLRFPEFMDAGEWGYQPLGDLARHITQKNHDGKVTRVLTNSAERGVINQRDYFEKDIATKGNLAGYSIVEDGDYVYNPRISASAPVGPVSKNNIGTGVMSPLYTVFIFNSEENDFYAHYFKSPYWYPYIQQASSTGARHDRVSIRIEDFMGLPLPVTSFAEQQKIADCLSSMDELITAQARKVEALKTHKKGLMQQLFPVADTMAG